MVEYVREGGREVREGRDHNRNMLKGRWCLQVKGKAKLHRWAG